jgi:hypothetical protein
LRQISYTLSKSNILLAEIVSFLYLHYFLELSLNKIYALNFKRPDFGQIENFPIEILEFIFSKYPYNFIRWARESILKGI